MLRSAGSRTHRSTDGGRLLLRRLLVAAAVLCALVAAGVALDRYATEFVIGGSGRQPVSMPPPSGTASSGALAFSFSDRPRALPDLRFVDGEGQAKSLADFRGRPVVLNIWATWCIPCRKEMPALDRLQGAIDTSRLVVLPLSIDRQGVPVVRKFYRALGLSSLGIYVDSSGEAAGSLGAVGLPTTLLVDREGREVGRKIGPAEWDSPPVLALVRRHLDVAAGDRKAGR